VDQFRFNQLNKPICTIMFWQVW